MIGTRLFLSAILTFTLVAGASAGALAIFAKKPKTEAQVKRLIETVKSDPDEKKRRAAIAELYDADPRVNPDVISCLVLTLQKDSSAWVRADAAEAMGQFKIVYPLAGLALEAAAELDASRDVRESAQQALWEYHLAGYRGTRGANGIAGQTVEPPIARPTGQRPRVTPAAVVDVVVPQMMPSTPRLVDGLPTVSVRPIPVAPRTILGFKPLNLASRPTLNPLAMLRSLLPPPVVVLATPEPPYAKRREVAMAPAPRSQGIQEVILSGEPFALPSISEPPGEPVEVKSSVPMSKPLLAPMEPLAPGPRMRPTSR